MPFVALSETGSGPVDVTVHYWDKREPAAQALRFGTGDEQVLDELFDASEGRRWSVPWNLVRVGGFREGSNAVEDLCAIAGALGYFPVTGTRDAATGTATVVVAGDMTDIDRAELLVTIASSLACDPREVSIVPALAPR